MNQAKIAVIGMAVMGANLARNFASRGIKTTVFNRTPDKTEGLIKNHGGNFLFKVNDYKELIESLEKPRKIILMIKAGTAVDETIDRLWPLLEEGDLIIDGGNSFYKDTIKRYSYLRVKGIKYVGMGISGGEEGALKGPSLMPGCSPEAFAQLEGILSAIAAKDFAGNACVTHVGGDGAGHFVKMTHNGIEYAIMQYLAEIYDFATKIKKLSPEKCADMFESWQSGLSASYLSEITIKILREKDTDQTPLINKILDKAEQKGTGSWTAIDALESGFAFPSVAEAVFARTISSEKDMRIALSEKTLQGKLQKGTYEEFPDIDFSFEKVFYTASLLAYAQGFQLIAGASKKHSWKINSSEICRIWQGGCIIRSKILSDLTLVFKESPEIFNPLQSDAFCELLSKGSFDLRRMVLLATSKGLPVSALSSSIQWLDQITNANSPANLISAMRDYFGAHTFQRNDKEGYFHHQWL